MTTKNDYKEDIDRATAVFETNLGTFEAELFAKECPETERPIRISTSIKEDVDYPQLLIKIVDQGTGISEEVKDTFFEPFITTKTSVGRGLGMTMARHSIQNLGGELTLEANSKAGATATLFYPMNPKMLPSNVLIIEEPSL